MRGPISHVVVIYLENRSVDDLFAAYYRDPFPGGGTWGNALDLQNPLAVPLLNANPLEAYFDPTHTHVPTFAAEALGQWSAAAIRCNATCPPGASVYSYVPRPEPDPYATFISNFAFANHVLQSNQGPSYPAHQYAIAGQSGGLPEPLAPQYAPYAQAENPEPAGSFDADERPTDSVPLGNCDGPAQYSVNTVDMTAPYPGRESPATAHPPCAEYPTILDSITKVLRLQSYEDWQYIASYPQSIWAAPMAVNHLYQHYTKASNKAIESFAVDPDGINFVNNIAHGSGNPVRPFAALTYITPCLHESDHPVLSGTSDGPQWLAYIVNAIGQSAYWPNTTIIVTWDDWGGFFDHYRPAGPALPFLPYPNPYKNSSDANEWGFRVPLIVISPYVTQRAYVSTRLRSQGAILNYIENTFGLPSLGADDATNGLDALNDMFDYTRAPLPYIPVPTTFNPSTVPSSCTMG